MDKIPTELWSQIFSYACTDTGYTARSLSQTSLYFNIVSKPLRFRSVVVRGVPQLIGFCRMLESTPEAHRIVHNLFLSSYERDYDYSNPNPEFKRALVEFYKPGIDPRSFQPTPEEILDEYEELVIHSMMRILVIAAPTIRKLHFWCTYDRVFLLPPVQLPEIIELTMHGPFTSILKASSEVTPTFPKLRRLWLSDIYIGVTSKPLSILSKCTPNLTHLRLEPANPHTEEFKSEVKRILNFPRARDGRSAAEPVPTATFPGRLRKLIIHPGYVKNIGYCGTSRLLQSSSLAALHRLTDDPRVTVCREYPRTHSEQTEEQDQLDSWLLPMAGRKSAWDED